MNMPDEIMNDFEKEIAFLPPTTRELYSAGKNKDLPFPIAYKKTIHISKAQLPDIMNIMSDTDKDMYDRLKQPQYQNIEHAFDNAELDLDTGILFLSKEQIQNIRKGYGFDLDVFYYEEPDYSKYPFLPKLNVPNEKDVPRLVLPAPEQVSVQQFSQKEMITLNSDLRIMTNNLPREFYKDIYIQSKLYHYDVDENRTYFAFCDIESKEGINEIVAHFDSYVNGKVRPTVMKLSNSTITRIEDETQVLFASYLSLPVCPAYIALSDYSIKLEETTPPGKFSRDVYNKVLGPWFRSPL